MSSKNPSELIDQQIARFPDWRGKRIAQLRRLIHEAAPKVTEEWKWETGVWTDHGLVCAIGAFKDHVKINFFKGNLLKDPAKVINSGFESKQHRAIDFHKDDEVNETAIINLVREAVALNR